MWPTPVEVKSKSSSRWQLFERAQIPLSLILEQPQISRDLGRKHQFNNLSCFSIPGRQSQFLILTSSITVSILKAWILKHVEHETVTIINNLSSLKLRPLWQATNTAWIYACAELSSLLRLNWLTLFHRNNARALTVCTKALKNRLFTLYFLNANENSTKWAAHLWVKSTRK